jgi:hypothetical protein
MRKCSEVGRRELVKIVLRERGGGEMEKIA